MVSIYSQRQSHHRSLFSHSLQDRDGEGGSLSGTGLSLSDTVSTGDDGHDSSLLDSRRSLETVGVNTSEEITLQLHVVEAGRQVWSHASGQVDSLVDDLVPVGLDDISVEFEIGTLAGDFSADVSGCYLGV